MKKLFYIFILLISTNIFSQNLEELTKKYIHAIGGEENIKNIKNIILEQTLYSNNYEGTQKNIIIVDKAYYSEMFFAGKKTILSVKDNKGWQINPFVSNKAIEMKEPELTTFMIRSSYWLPIYDYYKKNKNSYIDNIKIGEDKEVDKEICYRLLVNYKSKFVDTIYLSKKTFLPRKLENSIGIITYSNYKKIKNIMIPYNIELSNKAGSTIIEVLKVKFNEKINEQIFIKPD